jgi:hypothetical protein
LNGRSFDSDTYGQSQVRASEWAPELQTPSLIVVDQDWDVTQQDVHRHGVINASRRPKAHFESDLIIHFCLLEGSEPPKVLLSATFAA